MRDLKSPTYKECLISSVCSKTSSILIKEQECQPSASKWIQSMKDLSLCSSMQGWKEVTNDKKIVKRRTWKKSTHVSRQNKTTNRDKGKGDKWWNDVKYIPDFSVVWNWSNVKLMAGSFLRLYLVTTCVVIFCFLEFKIDIKRVYLEYQTHASVLFDGSIALSCFFLD